MADTNAPTPTLNSPARHDAYAALRSPNYRRFAAGFVVSSTGLQMLSTMVGWEVYERTDSTKALAYIGVARALPVILLALPAGHMIDTFSRKRVLAITQMAFAMIMLGLAGASYYRAPIWVMYILLSLSGFARVFNGPSRATLLPQIVDPEDFHNATTWNSGVFQFSATCGPLIAGYMREKLHAAWPVYIATAAACAFFGFLAMTLKPRAVKLNTDPWSVGSVTAGISHLWKEKTILAAITLDLLGMLLGGATGLFPVFARDILHTGPLGNGVLRSSVYIGAFLMALYLAHRPPMKNAGRALLLSVAAFGVSMIVFGLSKNYLLSVLCLAVGGAVDNVSVVIRHILVQVRTPEHLRGRVSSVNSVFIESSNEIGSYESGMVAAWMGPVFSVVSGGVGTLLVVAGVAAFIPQILRLKRLEPPSDPEVEVSEALVERGK